MFIRQNTKVRKQRSLPPRTRRKPRMGMSVKCMIFAMVMYCFYKKR